MLRIAKLVLGIGAIVFAVVAFAGGRLFGLSALELVAIAAGAAGGAALL